MSHYFKNTSGATCSIYKFGLKIPSSEKNPLFLMVYRAKTAGDEMIK
jgi:hypothetical protein